MKNSPAVKNVVARRPATKQFSFSPGTMATVIGPGEMTNQAIT